MCKYIILFSTALIMLCGCSTEISVVKTDRHHYFLAEAGNANKDLLPATSNLLANFLLRVDYENNPEQLLLKLRSIFAREHRSEYLAAMADTSLNFGHRYASSGKMEKAARYYLSASIFSYAYLALLDQPEKQPYSADRVQVMQIYNRAISEFFSYLSKRDLIRKDGYTIFTAMNVGITFRKVKYELPLKSSEYAEFLLCSDYKAKNLTHVSRHFGLGAPLICELVKKSDILYAKDQMLPATLVIHFDFNKDFSKIGARLVYTDPRDTDFVSIGKHQIPLAKDFSTPTAYMAKRPLPFGSIGYMLYPDRTKAMQGLYQFEPFHEKRIPVVLVHGLMSNTRTWIQMLNTLQSDPEIRKHYQFWGFSYSSGTPILLSAKDLRTALINKRAELIKDGKSTEMFDRMVLIGHSMGGLLSKTTIMDTKGRLLEKIMKKHPVVRNLSGEQKKLLMDHGVEFNHLPFIKRVVFIAVPHKGSMFARSWLGRLGSALIKMPRHVLILINDVFIKNDAHIATGIENLAPDNFALQALSHIPFVENIPYHSIIGNRKRAGEPGGTDGIVPYTSSHLDGATSELVVKSGHSAQQNPLGIQEVRRILLEHLRSYRDLAPVDQKKILQENTNAEKGKR